MRYLLLICFVIIGCGTEEASIPAITSVNTTLATTSIKRIAGIGSDLCNSYEDTASIGELCYFKGAEWDFASDVHAVLSGLGSEDQECIRQASE